MAGRLCQRPCRIHAATADVNLDGCCTLRPGKGQQLLGTAFYETQMPDGAQRSCGSYCLTNLDRVVERRDWCEVSARPSTRPRHLGHHAVSGLCTLDRMNRGGSLRNPP